jgi:predicted DNA-binding transcriptional regulator AlpA
MVVRNRIPDQWPRLMGADVAAAYCDLSVTTFRGLVKAGTFPKGERITAKRIVCLKDDLDAAIIRLFDDGAANEWEARLG